MSATEAAFLKPGMRVAVPFGKSKIYTGLVSAVHDTPPQGYEAKDIHQILDEVPLVTALQLQLWQWISAYYMCKVGEVMKAALPSSFLLESETVVRLQPDVDVDTVALDDDAFLVYQGLQLEPEMRVQDMSRIVPKQRALKVLNRLIQQGVVERVETVYEKYTPKTVRFVKLAKELAADKAMLRTNNNLISSVMEFTKGHGFDSVIITAAAPTNDPVELSAEITRKKGKVIVVGAVKMDIPRDPHFYRKELENTDPKLNSQIIRLAELRNEEGYMAEVRLLPEGWLLTQNHCPIYSAAKHCSHFCEAELACFQQALGAQADIERVDHVFTGSRRCTFKITATNGQKSENF